MPVFFRGLASSRDRSVCQRAGIILLETLFSLLLLSIFFLSFSLLVASGIRFAHTHDIRLRAHRLAHERAGELRLATLPSQGNTRTREELERDGVRYVVESDALSLNDNTVQYSVTVSIPSYDIRAVEKIYLVTLPGVR